MWLCLNNGFFSIVAQRDKADDRLVVRARREGDLERVFGVPGAASPGRDYAFRAYMERDAVASVVMCCVLGVDYPNFKDSVRDPRLHTAYARVWSVMGDLQVGGPYGSRLKRGPRRQSSFNYGPRDAASSVGFPWDDLDLQDAYYGAGLAEPLR